jgi:hypothetical protein
LRRKSYALSEEKQMFAEETAKVFGVPFKVTPAGPQPPQPDPNHIYSVPEKAVSDAADAKAKAAERWRAAVTRLGQYGDWRYLLVTDPSRLSLMLNAFTIAG